MIKQRVLEGRVLRARDIGSWNGVEQRGIGGWNGIEQRDIGWIEREQQRDIERKVVEQRSIGVLLGRVLEQKGIGDKVVEQRGTLHGLAEERGCRAKGGSEKRVSKGILEAGMVQSKDILDGLRRRAKR